MNTDLRNSKFLSSQVGINKELISSPSHAPYKAEGEAIKKRKFPYLFNCTHKKFYERKKENN